MALAILRTKLSLSYMYLPLFSSAVVIETTEIGALLTYIFFLCFSSRVDFSEDNIQLEKTSLLCYDLVTFELFLSEVKKRALFTSVYLSANFEFNMR